MACGRLGWGQTADRVESRAADWARKGIRVAFGLGVGLIFGMSSKNVSPH